MNSTLSQNRNATTICDSRSVTWVLYESGKGFCCINFDDEAVADKLNALQHDANGTIFKKQRFGKERPEGKDSFFLSSHGLRNRTTFWKKSVCLCILAMHAAQKWNSTVSPTSKVLKWNLMFSLLKDVGSECNDRGGTNAANRLQMSGYQILKPIFDPFKSVQTLLCFILDALGVKHSRRRAFRKALWAWSQTEIWAIRPVPVPQGWEGMSQRRGVLEKPLQDISLLDCLLDGPTRFTAWSLIEWVRERVFFWMYEWVRHSQWFYEWWTKWTQLQDMYLKRGSA